MPLGVLQVGALTLNENYIIADATNAQSGVRTVNISGIEVQPGRSLAQIRALADDLTSMYGKTVPVVFQHKSDRSGYYTIDDINTSAVHWEGEAASFTWSLGLTRIGPDNAVDIESRLTHVVRLNDFSKTGERWHAPPIEHQGYYVGAVAPATVVRTGFDGPITVYRAIPAVNPRYACSVGSFLGGRVRLLDSSGIERTGQRIGIPVIGWELNNGLVRVKPYSGGLVTTLLIAFHDGTDWREKPWDIRVAGSSLVPANHFQSLTVIRLDPEAVILRILARQPSTNNRVLLDLVLRRGSRYIAGHLQRSTSGDIAVAPEVADPSTAGIGYVISSVPDANGLLYVTGSAKSHTPYADGGLTKAATTTLDFFVGAEVTADSGDSATALHDQYIAAGSEATMVVAR